MLVAIVGNSSMMTLKTAIASTKSSLSFGESLPKLGIDGFLVDTDEPRWFRGT